MYRRPVIHLFYLLFLGALGCYWPYFPLYLARVGVGPAEATRILAIAPALALCTPPLWGLLADARRIRIWLLRLGVLGAWLSFVGVLASGPRRIPLYAASFLFALFRSPLTSLADASAVEQVRRHGGSYGQIRLWGSIGFLVAVAATGPLAVSAPWQTLQIGAVVLAGAAICAWFIPAPPTEVRENVLGTWLTMLRERTLWRFLGAAVLAQVAGAAYDSCFSMHLRALGYDGRTIGILWALGVASEVMLLAVAGKLVARFGAERLFAAAIATAAARWLLVARVTSKAALFALQPLHGITFSLFYVPAVMIVRERATHETATSAQGLLASALGCGSMLGMLMTGQVFERWGGATLYSISSSVAALGALSAYAYARAMERTRAQPIVRVAA